MANDPYDRGGRYLQRGDDELLRWFLTRTASECHLVTWLDTRSLVWPGAASGRRGIGRLR